MAAAPFTRVLVVDDDPGTALFLVKMLQRLDYEAKALTDPARALAEVAAFRPQIVLLDIYMPEVHGWEVARQLRAAFSRDELKVIAISVSNSGTDRIRSRQAGIDAHVVKPVEVAELEAILNELAGSPLDAGG